MQGFQNRQKEINECRDFGTGKRKSANAGISEQAKGSQRMQKFRNRQKEINECRDFGTGKRKSMNAGIAEQKKIMAKIKSASKGRKENSGSEESEKKTEKYII